MATSANAQAPNAAGPLLPELIPGEDVWASLSLPSVTLLATDRRLLTLSESGLRTWDYAAIVQVGPAGIEGDVVISFADGRTPLVVHTAGDETAMQALTVIGLLVAQSRRVERVHAERR